MSTAVESTATAVTPSRGRLLRPLLAELIAIAVCVGLMLLAMIAAFMNRGYNSDDVAFQLIYDRLAKQGHVDVVTDVDTFLIKAPFDLAATSLFGYTRRALLAAGIMSALVELAGIVAVTHITARLGRGASLWRVLVAYAPVAAFCALCQVPYSDKDPATYTFDNAVQFLNVNGRNAEIGLGLLAFAGLAALAEAKRLRWWHAVLFVLGGLLSGVLLYSDQFYLFSLFAAALVASFLWWAVRRRSWIPMAGAVVYTGLALVVFSRMRAWGKHIGIEQVPNKGSFITPDKVYDGLFGGLESVFRQLHADIFGMDYASRAAAQIGLNLLLPVLVLVVLGWGWARLTRLSALELLVVVSATLTLVAFALSNRAGDPHLSRYAYPAVVMAVSLCGALLCRMLQRVSLQRLGATFVAALCLSVLANAAYSAQMIRKPFYANPQGVVQQIIEHADAEGVTKGYGGYWAMNPVTYLSGGRVTAAPIGCVGDNVGRFFWLTDRAALEKPAQKSFLVLAQREIGEGCAPDKKAGKPVRTYQLPEGSTMFIYDHDIGASWSLFNFEKGY